MVAPKTNAYSLIEAKPFSPHLGAEVYGVDLSETISDAQFAEILDAFLKYQVLFFKNQKEILQNSMLFLVSALDLCMPTLRHQRWRVIQKSLKYMLQKILRLQTVSFGTLMSRVMTRHHLGQCCKST